MYCGNVACPSSQQAELSNYVVYKDLVVHSALVCAQCFQLHTDINIHCRKSNLDLQFLTDNERTNFKAGGSFFLFFVNSGQDFFFFLYGRSRLFLYVTCILIQLRSRQ